MQYVHDSLSHEANEDGDYSDFTNDDIDSEFSFLSEADNKASVENDFSEVTNPLFDEEVDIDHVVFFHNAFEDGFNEFSNPLYEETTKRSEGICTTSVCE